MRTQADSEHMIPLLSSLKYRNTEAHLRVEGSMVWPPMERNTKIAELFEESCLLAHEIRFELGEASVGGASDGCFCAALGVPVLDGLGAVGAETPAPHEHVEVGSMPLVPRWSHGCWRRGDVTPDPHAGWTGYREDSRRILEVHKRWRT